jgi:hypothetical protein
MSYNALITARLPSRIGFRQDMIMSFVANNPGCTAADADRATNHYVQNHAHYVTYDAVKRLIRRGLLRVEVKGGRNLLYIA